MARSGKRCRKEVNMLPGAQNALHALTGLFYRSQIDSEDELKASERERVYSAALDPRIKNTHISGYINNRNDLHKEPIYRNVWKLLREFGKKR